MEILYQRDGRAQEEKSAFIEMGESLNGSSEARTKNTSINNTTSAHYYTIYFFPVNKKTHCCLDPTEQILYNSSLKSSIDLMTAYAII